MEAAKAAVNKIVHRDGQHDTTVTESYAPAVTHEQINPTREHEHTTAIDKEVHQDHHHTSVLPVQHQETLPTEHHHRLGETKHVEHHHGDHKGIHSNIAAEHAQFKDQTTTAPTEVTRSDAGVVAGEHRHHHVHEHIQPVIQKQTIQPSVVHETNAVHETHHLEPKHYTASSLPAVSLEEFKAQGGSLTGLADRTEHFKGEPQNIASHHGHGHHGHHDTTTGATGTTGSSGLTGSNTAGTTGTGLTGSNTSGTTGTGLTGSSTTGTSDLSRSNVGGTTGTGTTGTTGSASVPSAAHSSSTNPIAGPGNPVASHSSSTTSDSTGKPSLLQKLNPFKDTDGDGKKGIMD